MNFGNLLWSGGEYQKDTAWRKAILIALLYLSGQIGK
jgi:hypothetical protein